MNGSLEWEWFLESVLNPAQYMCVDQTPLHCNGMVYSIPTHTQTHTNEVEMPEWGAGFFAEVWPWADQGLHDNWYWIQPDRGQNNGSIERTHDQIEWRSLCFWWWFQTQKLWIIMLNQIYPAIHSIQVKYNIPITTWSLHIRNWDSCGKCCLSGIILLKINKIIIMINFIGIPLVGRVPGDRRCEDTWIWITNADLY